MDLPLSPGARHSRQEKMKLAAGPILVAALLLGGCSGKATTDQKAVSGEPGGAERGPLRDWASDWPGCGVNLGGAPGMLGGGIYDTIEFSRGRP